MLWHIMEPAYSSSHADATYADLHELEMRASERNQACWCEQLWAAAQAYGQDVKTVLV